MEENIFKYFGLCDGIISDNAQSFRAKAIEEICESLNIDNRHTLPYNPNPNQSERIHKNLGEILRALINEDQHIWDEYIPAINLAFNSAKSRATSFSPYFLMFGRSPRIELDILGGKRTTGVEEDDHVYETLQKMTAVFDIVDKTIKKNLDYRAKEYANTTSLDFEVDKHVLVFTPARKVGEASKLVRAWSLPFRITKKINEVCYELESLNWANPRFKIVRSITHMKSYKGPTEFRNVKHQVNPTLFMSKHQFEIIEDDEDLEILEENTPSSYVDQNSQERIRLPSGQWILRNRITG